MLGHQTFVATAIRFTLQQQAIYVTAKTFASVRAMMSDFLSGNSCLSKADRVSIQFIRNSARIWFISCAVMWPMSSTCSPVKYMYAYHRPSQGHRA